MAALREKNLANRRPTMPSLITTLGGIIAAVCSRCQSQRNYEFAMDTLAGIQRALKPGTRFAAIVLSTAEKLPHISESLAIARRHAGLPPAPFEDPGMFALGDPAVLRSTFERAGFREVAVEIVASAQRFPSLAAAMEHRRNSLPEMRPFLEQISDAKREAVWKEIEMVMRQFERSDGVIVPTERLVAVGTK